MAYLLVTTDTNKGVLYRLGVEKVILGRDPGCAVVVMDKAASRQHASLVLKNNTYQLDDLDSTNRTFVNSLPVKNRSLQEGDEIRIGSTVLKFFEGDADRATAAPLGPTALLSDARTAAPPMVSRAEAMRSDIMVGQSPALQGVFDRIAKAAASDATVLILGPTGTGKELVARAIHFNGSRRSKAFEAINCSAIPEQLMEAELFGYEKGAFTGAVADKPGRFELAHEGTLFLDEIGEMPIALQPKLLRVLETSEIRRVGGVKTIRVNVRVLCSTHRDLAAEMKAGRFREDLYYRLRVLEIILPPLRERDDDVLVLARHFLDTFCSRMGKPCREIEPDVEAVFRRYPWPGNVRELKNIVERAVILCDGPKISMEHLPLEMTSLDMGGLDKTERKGMLDSLKDIEAQYIRMVLQKVSGNKTTAAKILGIDRSTLYAKLKEMGVDEGR